MDFDCLSVKRLRALPLWSGPVVFEPLLGGITNRNYLVRDGERRFVARLCRDKSELGIDRRNEVACQKAAWSVGLAPEVIHHEDGVLISAHLPARTLTPADVRDPILLRRIARTLRWLHESWDGLSGEMLYFSPFQTVRTYARTARALGATLPADIDDLLEDARRLARRIKPFTPTLCHNDLLAANILADEGSVRLVDWEYAGIGHPLFDLAGLSGNCGLSDAQDKALLRAYRGHVRPRDLHELRILKATSLLREALWAVIQTVASDLDFDYRKYAADNFAAYRAARRRLKIPRPLFPPRRDRFDPRPPDPARPINRIAAIFKKLAALAPRERPVAPGPRPRTGRRER